MNVTINPKRPTILIMSGTYLPGTKNGGPVRSLSNMVEWLGDDFNFLILTADRDNGDFEPYPNLYPNEWHAVGKACVRYLAPSELRLHSLSRIIRQTQHDLLFIDSVLGHLSVLTLLARRLGLLPKKPIVITPRGHISAGALNIKNRKKRVFLEIGKATRLFRNLNWLVSSEEEKADVLREFGTKIQIEVIPNLTAVSLTETTTIRPPKVAGKADFVFLSRITPKKNLDYLLTQLRYTEGDVILDIYGPIEDGLYWKKCQTLIQQLPFNIKVGYKGTVSFDKVTEVLSRYHLFILPTLSENFGHVILEALSSGCPVLISDQTPWNTINNKGAGWTLPLGETLKFQEKIQAVITMSEDNFSKVSKNASTFTEELLHTDYHINLLSKLFSELAG